MFDTKQYGARVDLKTIVFDKEINVDFNLCQFKKFQGRQMKATLVGQAIDNPHSFQTYKSITLTYTTHFQNRPT